MSKDHIGSTTIDLSKTFGMVSHSQLLLTMDKINAINIPAVISGQGNQRCFVAYEIKSENNVKRSAPGQLILPTSF